MLQRSPLVSICHVAEAHMERLFQHHLVRVSFLLSFIKQELSLAFCFLMYVEYMKKHSLEFLTGLHVCFWNTECICIYACMCHSLALEQLNGIIYIRCSRVYQGRLVTGEYEDCTFKWTPKQKMDIFPETL
jgi:hypothetical protein